MIKKLICTLAAGLLLGGAVGVCQNIEADFAPYMRNMQMKIKSNWEPPKGSESKRVVLLYTLDDKGKILNYSIKKSSMIKDVDKSAVKALKKSAPFGPFPEGTALKTVDVQFTFDYNVFGQNVKKQMKGEE